MIHGWKQNCQLLNLQLIKINKMRQSLELQDKEQSVDMQLVPEHEPRTKHQTTTKCSYIAVPEFDFQSCIISSTDLSFQVEMHRENVEAIKLAVTKYLEQCLIGEYSKQLGFKDASLYLYKQHPAQAKEECALDQLITQNELFSYDMKKEICTILKEQDNLTRFLRQIPQVFGLTVGKQMVFLIYRIFKQKNEKYKQFINGITSIIPNFSCLQDLQIMKNADHSCPVYEDIELEQVVSFAEKDIEQIANRLYFADIKVLNLKLITAEINPKANLYKEFAVLIRRISRSVFLTLAGGTDPTRQNSSLFEIPREVSFTQFSEVALSIHKSLSRPSVPYDDEEVYDFISKKIKFQ